jgi:hypothetical protein
MISLLGFVLECAAVAAAVGAATGVACAALALASRPLLHRLPPARRADAFFVLGASPALAAVAVVSSAAAPSLLAAVGLAADHCSGHTHHVHLCILHSAGLRPALAALGALAAAVFLFRAGSALGRAVDSVRLLRALEQLGQRSAGAFPLVLVPGSPWLCHAAGPFDRRVLLSSSLSAVLPSAELGAALAHEHAHLNRRDPLARLVLHVAGLAMPPLLDRFFLTGYSAAAEEACDAEAAACTGNACTVADALVKVAELQRSAGNAAAASLAFGEGALERRVRALTSERLARPRAARGLLVLTLLVAAGLSLALSHAAMVHHTVETLLHLTF